MLSSIRASHGASGRSDRANLASVTVSPAPSEPAALVTRIERSLRHGASPAQIGQRHGETAEMYARYLSDDRATLKSIGDEWGGVTRERVRQRFAASGLPSRSLTQTANIRRARRIQEIRNNPTPLRDAWKRGRRTQEIASDLGVRPVDVRALVRELVSDAERTQRQQALVERSCCRRQPLDRQTRMATYATAVREAWEACGRPAHLTGDQYAAAARTQPNWPSVSSIVAYFRWVDVLQAAGLTAPPAQRRREYTRITPEACWDALHAVARETQSDGAPPRLVYLELSTGRTDLPCATTVARRLGGWTQIRSAWPGPGSAREPQREPIALAA